MKNFILILLAVLTLISCEKDAAPRPKSYPLLLTDPVTDIDSTGALFSASLENKGVQKINDFGFILESGGRQYKFSLAGTADIDNCRYRCNVGIEAGKMYSVRSYAATDEYFIKGNEVIFTGRGSRKPEIIDFYPESGYDGTEITMHCKYLVPDTAGNKVFIEGNACEVLSVSNETITFRTPEISFFGEAKIRISNGVHETVSNKTFAVLGPSIYSITPSEGKSGTMVKIRGENFLKNGNSLFVSFDAMQTFLMSSSDTEAEVMVPATDYLFDKSFTVSLTNGHKTIVSNKPFLLRKSWEVKAATPFNWGWHYDAFSYNGAGYILELNTKELYRYSADLNSWEAVPSSLFPGERNEYSVYALEGDVLFKAGGRDYMGNKLNEVWAYNFVSGNWEARSNIPFSFYHATFFTLKGYTFIITDEGQVWKCDLTHEVYTRMNDFPEPFTYSFTSAFMAGNQVYAVNYGSTYKYDELNDAWSLAGLNPITRENYSEPALGFTFNNTGYVLASGSDLYKYDLLNNRWLLVSKYPAYENSYKVVFTASNKAFFAATSSSYVGGSPLMFSYEE